VSPTSPPVSCAQNSRPSIADQGISETGFPTAEEQIAAFTRGHVLSAFHRKSRMRAGSPGAVNTHDSAVHVEIFITRALLLSEGNEAKCQLDEISFIRAMVRKDVRTSFTEIAGAAFGLALQAGLINPAVENRSFQRIANLLSPAAHGGSGSCHDGFLNAELQPGYGSAKSRRAQEAECLIGIESLMPKSATGPIIHRLEYKDTQSFPILEITFLLQDL
jgi:hypothetical protein